MNLWLWLPKEWKLFLEIQSVAYQMKSWELGLILSLLPTKIAASTSVLSKRWRNLFLLVDNLDFDESIILNPNKNSSNGDLYNNIENWFCPSRSSLSYLDFMEKTVALLRDSPIKKFSLKWNSMFDDSRINHMIYTVLNRGVLELQLSASICQYIEPEFFSKTLVKLTLYGGCYEQRNHPPGGVLFPALKTLSLFFVSGLTFIDPDLYDCLLASPVLEEFNICDDDPLRIFLYSGWVRQVWGSSIRRISIFYRSLKLQDHSCFVINTPNLVYLDYSSYVAQDYVVQFDSLVEAKLDLRLWGYYDYVPPPGDEPPYGYVTPKYGDYWGDASKIVAAIRNVVTLHLSADSLEVFYLCSESIPEFNNLVKLSFESHKERSWQVLPLLLKKSPNLEILVIKGLVHQITDQCGDACVCVHEKKNKSCLLSCRVKMLKIYEYGESCREVKQMRQFMENLKCLEAVNVKIQVDEQDKYLPVITVIKLIRIAASSNCKIQFI